MLDQQQSFYLSIRIIHIPFKPQFHNAQPNNVCIFKHRSLFCKLIPHKTYNIHAEKIFCKSIRGYAKDFFLTFLASFVKKLFTFFNLWLFCKMVIFLDIKSQDENPQQFLSLQIFSSVSRFSFSSKRKSVLESVSRFSRQ